jgi:CRP-like cAMP-binding protein
MGHNPTMRQLTVGSSDLGALAGMMRKMDFFAPLTVGQLELILPHVMLCAYEPGETVFKKGSPGDAFYVVYQGKVAVRLPRMVLLSRTVATLGPGDFFGESALVSAAPRNATVAAVEPARLFTLIASDFQFILNENPAAAAEMRRIAAQRSFVSSHSS